jgi:peptidyl-prolyl cis-trans isomerase B (cyclophilin B)
MDVVDQIVAVPTDSLDAPLTPIKIDVNVIQMTGTQLKEMGFEVKK